MLRRWLALAALLAGVTLMVGSARALSRRFLFPSSQCPNVDAARELQRHRATARDGVGVHLLLTPASAGKPTFVYFHNNRETVEARADVAHVLAERGCGSLLIEYRGYGESSSRPAATEAGLYADAEAGLDWLNARGVSSEKIVLWGTSLGTGVAAEMARRGRGSRLLLTTPYTSIPDLVTATAPFVPARMLVPDHFDTIAKAPEIRVPTLVIHGDADEIVPFWMGERVTTAIPGARLLRVAGGKHGDLFAREPERLWAAVFDHAG